METCLLETAPMENAVNSSTDIRYIEKLREGVQALPICHHIERKCFEQHMQYRAAFMRYILNTLISKLNEVNGTMKQLAMHLSHNSQARSQHLCHRAPKD